MRGLECWNCGTEGKHNESYEKDGLYVCSNCGKVNGYLCYGCDRVFLENRLIQNGDVWVCKDCGQPHYGYTQWMRNKKGRDQIN